MTVEGSLTRRAVSLITGAALGLLVATAPAVAAEDPAATMYSPGTVDAIDLNLSQAAIDSLEAEPDEYVEGTFSLAPTDGTPGGEEAPLTPTPLTVGVRLKGNVQGSFRDLTQKAAFKIKFNEFVSGQKFLGLKKMTLNNMVEDPSMIHETLTYTAFRDSGVPAPRTGYAYVRVNGDDYGLYLNIETLDEVALKKMFGAFDDKTQHLYEGENGADVKPGGATDFEIDEGDDEDLGDLEALIAAVDSTSSDWAGAVAPFADLREMTRMWALDKYVGRWDGYAGEKRGLNQPNNYYLYSDPLGRFQMLPWGSDETWEEHLPFDGAAGLMFDRCLTDGSCAATYWESLGAVRTAVAGAGLDSLAVATADRLQPWQAIDPRKEESVGQIAAAVAAARAFLAARPGEADEWLAGHVPPSPPPAAEAKPVPVPTPLPAPAPAGPFFRLGHIAKDGGALRFKLRLLAPGLVTQRALLSTRRGSLVACSDRIKETAAGPVTLRCRLSAAVRQRLRKHRLRLTVTTRVVPDGGAPEAIVSHVVVPRLRSD
jgi:CotH kinase protein